MPGKSRAWPRALKLEKTKGAKGICDFRFLILDWIRRKPLLQILQSDAQHLSAADLKSQV
jgi:hypothetical protein